ncbi:FAD:protein FMN transferase [Cohnella rhizosphaerae]|uniref:FAD:protein FMN transferase n=1 Tax=Cohnella rhizosphaerae TaxID=1457232 RepID=A0A9X4QTV8_9BACL|nr:FAD:protein FMN transferase [Cohnella rhizosphaerae]MDG0810793.1 FAD:protein FMN transferase [Cohnella rhizosphaerae]
MENDSFRAMNTTIATQGLPVRWRAQARSWFAFAEAQLSRFLPDSELSKLNRAAGGPFLATPLLYQVLAEADRYHRETVGLFSPYLGRVMERLGYGESFERLSPAEGNDGSSCCADGAAAEGIAHGGRIAGRIELGGKVPAADARGDGLAGADARGGGLADRNTRNGGLANASECFSAAELDPGSRAIRLRADVAVDLGGIAKGWTARHLAKLARQDGVRTGAVGAGGDLILWGCPPEGWRIGVADPWRPERDATSLTPRRGAGIATSSAVKRRWQDRGGSVRHHLVDPRTGDSARTDLAQATVIAPDAVMAEVYAKCALLLGADEGPAWLERTNPRCAMIGVRYDGSLVYGGDLQTYGIEERASDERIG